MWTSKPPSTWVNRPAIQIGSVLIYGAALTGYVLLLMPLNGKLRPLDFLFMFAAGFWPITINLLCGDRPVDSGIRLDNLKNSARPVLLFTLAGALFVSIVGLLSGGFHWQSAKTLAEKSAVYLLWGPAQQYLLNSFGMRRLRQAGLNPAFAALLAAAVFAAIHSPNWPLVAVTFLGGLGWCMLFARWPNLPLLGLSQGFLAVLIYHAWPDEWLARLTIGRMYLHRMGLL